MKKLIIICFVLVSANSFSQSFGQNIAKRLSFGLKAGANYGNFTNTNFNTEGLFGYQAGATVNFRISEHFSFEEDFMYSYQGAKTKDNIFGDKTIAMSYLIVPVVIKYRTSPGIYLELGTQAGILLNDADLPGKFAKPTDIGAVAGFGYQAKKGFGLGVRYVAGVTSVANFDSFTINNDFKSGVFQTNLSYRF